MLINTQNSVKCRLISVGQSNCTHQCRVCQIDDSPPKNHGLSEGNWERGTLERTEPRHISIHPDSWLHPAHHVFIHPHPPRISRRAHRASGSGTAAWNGERTWREQGTRNVIRSSVPLCHPPCSVHLTTWERP
jgi:hypothetical protein